MYKGVDVSSYQGVIDWTKAKAAGVDFAILKVMRKDLTPDKQFERNWAGCLAAGVPIQSVYNYTYATTAEKSASDARQVLAILGPDRHPTVVLDYEDKSLPTGKDAAKIINAYGDVITEGGCKFAIYFGMAYYNENLKDAMPYIKQEYKKGWEARYYNGYKVMNITDDVDESQKPVNFDGELYGWQYTSSGRVDGIEGSVDLDVWYEDIEAADSAVPETAAYGLADFIVDSRGVWGVSATASAKEIVAKTVTVSTAKNKSHTIVTALERYMQWLGYYTGLVEEDRGKTPLFGNGMKKAIILYQANVVKARVRNQDGELTAGGATWRKLYGAA